MSVGKLLRQSLPFSNVVVNGVATSMITAGRTLERIVFKLGGTSFTKAMMNLVKIKANGKVFFEGSGAQIDKLMRYRGLAAADGFLVIDFTELIGRDKLDQMIGAFDTSKGIANITVEVTIAGANAPTLEAYVIESGAQVGAYSPIMSKVLRYPFSTSVGGTLPIVLPFGSQNGAVIKRVHVEQAAVNVTGVTVKQDGLVIHESQKALNEFLQLEMGRVPQAGTYTIDFILDGTQGNALDTRDAKSMEWFLTLSGADNGFVIVEYYDLLGNL